MYLVKILKQEESERERKKAETINISKIFFLFRSKERKKEEEGGL